MLNIVIVIALVMVTLSFVLSFIRMIIGPSVPDRVLAMDTLYINAIALLILIGLFFKSALYFEAALLIAVMGFMGTVALSKYLMRGDIME